MGGVKQYMKYENSFEYLKIVLIFKNIFHKNEDNFREIF